MVGVGDIETAMSFSGYQREESERGTTSIEGKCFRDMVGGGILKIPLASVVM
jgi:hypothetical protein